MHAAGGTQAARVYEKGSEHMKVFTPPGWRRCWRWPRRRSRRAAGPPAPIDPQNWSFQDNLTWSDYQPLPGTDYSNPDIAPTVKKWKVALVVTDFPDKPFTSRSRPGSTIFGTPTAEANNIPRADVPAFYRDFLNKPQALNHFQTMNRYWMEDSFGKYGVQLDAFGPYRCRAAPTSTS